MSGPVIGIAAHQALVEEVDTRVLHHVTNSAYVKAVRKGGGVPVLLPLIDVSDAETFLDAVDGVLLTGGDDVDPASYGHDRAPETVKTDPVRDELELALAGAVVERDHPTLAICRGCQVMNVALGGTLTQHVEDHFELDRYNQTVHTVKLTGGTALERWLPGAHGGVLEVNSLHHQSVEALGPRTRIAATADDGTVEALEFDGAPNVVAVQWHPELLRHRPDHLGLFAELVRRAGQRRGGSA
ncbi:MAG TPA: gamma-glutamyl-gamma-aminobutyrate hydrolase family protein [Acidimicrobiales bacterium]|nr:gamma-glutamyl-gamma-aminobutyrate hydrolase family protein [Acidimicrobiales bacterium]